MRLFYQLIFATSIYFSLKFLATIGCGTIYSIKSKATRNMSPFGVLISHIVEYAFYKLSAVRTF